MAVDLRIGDEFAGHRIKALIGRGGMGVVYLAEHLRLGRKVAIKVLSPDLADDEAFRRRFIRESQLAAALEHPNIVPVYDAGEAGDLAFISMRYVEGEDLSRVLHTEHVLAPEPSVRIAEQIASALDAAHGSGLVHRDVKPENILLERPHDGAEQWRAYLSDFGITKRTSSTKTTETGQFIGTIDYVAPEQITGAPTDGRTDQYSLACVLFESLTGEVPYPRLDQIAVMYAQLHDPPPRASERLSDLPEAVDPVIQRGLAKTPDDRFPSCGEFVESAADALHVPTVVPRAGRGPAVVDRTRAAGARPAAPVGPWPSARGAEQASRRRGRGRTALAVAAAIAIAGAAAGAWLVLGRQGPRAAGQFPAGFTWARVPDPGGVVFGGAGDQTLYGAIVGQGLIVAVGSTTDTPDGKSDGAVWASPNGVAWHRETVRSAGGVGDQTMAAVGLRQDRFVAVGSDSAVPGDENGVAWTSAHGYTWQRSLSLTGESDQEIHKVIQYGDSLLAVGFDSPPGQHRHASVWSYQGGAWTAQYFDSFAGPGNEEMWGVTRFQSQDLIAVGTASRGGDQDAAVWRFDGSGWARVDTPGLREPGTQIMRAVVASGPGLVAVGSDTAGDGTNAAVWTSQDGKTWFRVLDATLGAPGDQEMTGAIADAGGVVAIGSDATAGHTQAAVWISPDGEGWERSRDQELGGPDDQWMSAAVRFGDLVVAVGRRTGPTGLDSAVWIGTPIGTSAGPSSTPTQQR